MAGRSVVGAIVLAVAIAGAAPAWATASFDCSAKDAAVEFDVRGVLSHGMGEVVTSLDGSIGIAGKGIPEPLLKVVLDLKSLTQVWTHGRAFKLRLYTEPGTATAGSAVEIIVETEQSKKDETAYQGRYEINVTVADAKAGGEARVTKLKGKAACSLG